MDSPTTATMIDALPAKQRQVLEAIMAFITDNGYPPSIQQLCQACGVSSTSTIHYHLTALKKKGYLHWNESERRAITVNESVMGPRGGHGQVPICGSIAAGQPVQAYTDIEDTLNLAEDLCPKTSYALRVRGDSMIEDHIMEGDLVLVNPDVTTIRQGDVVVAVVDNETTTLKRYYKEASGLIRLQPANADMDPIYVQPEQLVLQGRVEALIRQDM